MGEDETRGEVSPHPEVRKAGSREGETVVALSSACGGSLAVVRISGAEAFAIATREGLPLEPWVLGPYTWGGCPCRVLAMPGPRTFTGCDTVEIQLPGSRDVVDLVLDRLVAAGATRASPGAFTRQAVANGRLRLDQAEAVLALVHASDATQAAAAVARLRGVLGTAVAAVREQLIAARAQVESGLDFLEEDDVRAYEPATMRRALATLAQQLAAFRTTADAEGGDPVVALVGMPNAGKSALFVRLTGESALVSPIPGTTRDWLEGTWMVAGRPIRLIDTAGWLAQAEHLDAAGIERGWTRLAGTALIIACNAPDAPLPVPLPPGLDPDHVFILSTKADCGPLPGELAVSVIDGRGLEAFTTAVAQRLAVVGSGNERQQTLLATAHGILAALAQRLPEDALLADDLRRAADACGDLIGLTTTDDVLEAIFSTFCIGK